MCLTYLEVISSKPELIAWQEDPVVPITQFYGATNKTALLFAIVVSHDLGLCLFRKLDDEKIQQLEVGLHFTDISHYLVEMGYCMMADLQHRGYLLCKFYDINIFGY